jgi:predicted PurR-regulated permease PerM
MATAPGGTKSVKDWIDLLLPLFLTGLLIALCFQLLLPFVGLLLWTIILAVCFNPLQEKLLARGWKPGRAAMLLGGVLVAVVLVPTVIAAMNAASGIPTLVSSIQNGTAHVRPPPPALESIPVAGPKLHAAWAQAATDFPSFLKEHREQLKEFSRWLVTQAGGILMAVLGLILAVILAAVALAYAKGLRAFFAAVFARITGSQKQGEHLMEIIGATIKSVANGVIGVAFVQALLVGIGFFVGGVPGAGLLSLAAFFLGIVQFPVLIVTLPAIAWAWSAMETTPAIIFTIWSLVSGVSDAVLKPMLIGHGLEVPMPVILLGVIGGVMAFGLVGLFIGAVILAVGYVLFYEWLGKPVVGAEGVAPKVKAD